VLQHLLPRRSSRAREARGEGEEEEEEGASLYLLREGGARRREEVRTGEKEEGELLWKTQRSYSRCSFFFFGNSRQKNWRRRRGKCCGKLNAATAGTHFFF
jgi:hypothetical protein